MFATISRPASRTRVTTIAGLVAAALIAVMLLAQLYGFEYFASILLLVSPTMSQADVASLAAGIVVVELLSLPYLLNMHMSVLFRAMSAFTSFCVAMYWLMTAMTNSHASNIGMFSDTLVFAGGIAPFLVASILIVCIGLVLYSDTKVNKRT